MVNYRRVSSVIAVSLFVITITLVLVLKPRFQSWMYMQPYNRLVNSRATESEIISKIGTPNKVITNDKELSRFMNSHRPFRRVNTHVESKVLIYWADPFNDAEGYAVYIFLDQEAKAADAVMGGG